MRTTGLVLLLLPIAALIAYPHIGVKRSATHPAAAATGASASDKWRYSEQAPFHEYLDDDVRQYTSSEPEETAQRVCAELGGDAGFVEAPRPDRATVGFLCRFTEPDVTMSVDFGELDRIPAR